jgi:hypothetical protein
MPPISDNPISGFPRLGLKLLLYHFFERMISTTRPGQSA